LKEKFCIYIIPPFQIFNLEDYPIFENFSVDFSQQLFATLYKNYFEILPEDSKYNVVFLLSATDQNHIPEDLLLSGRTFYFVESLSFENIIAKLKEKYFPRYSSNLIINSGLIGITPANIDRTFNLLNSDDNTFVLDRTLNNKIGYVGFNSFDEKINGLYKTNEADFETSLADICLINSNIHVFTEGQIIKDINDFKVLYKELSSKDSFAYCSQTIHELFTNIFIEYKELL
jgi:hypothetical protein